MDPQGVTRCRVQRDQRAKARGGIENAIHHGQTATGRVIAPFTGGRQIGRPQGRAIQIMRHHAALGVQRKDTPVRHHGIGGDAVLAPVAFADIGGPQTGRRGREIQVRHKVLRVQRHLGPGRDGLRSGQVDGTGDGFNDQFALIRFGHFAASGVLGVNRGIQQDIAHAFAGTFKDQLVLATGRQQRQHCQCTYGLR